RRAHGVHDGGQSLRLSVHCSDAVSLARVAVVAPPSRAQGSGVIRASTVGLRPFATATTNMPMNARASWPAPLLRPARAVGFGGLTAALLGAYELHRRVAPAVDREALLDRYRKAWLSGLLTIFGVRLTVLSGPPPAAKRARLVVANHRSALDIGV